MIRSEAPFAVSGDPDVITRIKDGEPTCLVVGAGAQKGLIPTAIMVAMKEAQKLPSITQAVLSSTGSSFVLVLGGEDELALKIYTTVNPDGPIFRPWWPIMNMKVIREATNHLDPHQLKERVKASKTDVRLALTQYSTGKTLHVPVEKFSNILHGLEAAITMPILSGVIGVNAEPYGLCFDGGADSFFPLKFALQAMNPNLVLALPNFPPENIKRREFISYGLLGMALRVFSKYRPVPAEIIRHHPQAKQDSISMLQEIRAGKQFINGVGTPVRLAVIHPTTELLGASTLNKSQLNAAAQRARDFAYDLFR